MIHRGFVFTERDEYEKAFAEAWNYPAKASLLTSLIAYTTGAGERERQILTMDSEYTLQVLYRLGFIWPITSGDYFRRFMVMLNGLGFFKETGDIE
ncbi:MAG: hypothetical protein IJM25_06665 [Eubacterium sp.]|nr:hypothetical protein [Eubacterium sp.]